MRQPCPSNVLFHDIYVKACDKILNNHLFKPSQQGTAHSEFNRHLAAHLLYDAEFATQGNCIRLFLLLDTMTEIYLCESRQPDPRFSLAAQDFEADLLIYASLMLDGELKDSPEKKCL